VEVVVVVPTRNRADLVPTTIASALAGDDPRVSVLVSDNSTDTDQVERLQSWCAGKSGSPLRYVRPERPLPMSAHWQWALERALESPATSNVMFLTDRLLMRPRVLGELLDIVERHPADVITFGDDTIVDHRQPVTIFERPWTGKLLRIDADQVLSILSRGILLAAPTMLNTIVPRVVLQEIERAYGNVFASIAPDLCFTYRCLDRVDSIVHWDRALIVQRALARSNGYSQIRGVANADHADFVRELGDSRINEHAPIPELLTVTNAIYNEYEYVRMERPSSKLEALSRHYYLGANARDVARLEDPRLKARMDEVLAEHGWSTRTRLRYVLGLCLSAARYYWRRPRALLGRLRGRGAAPLEFEDSAQALAYTMKHPAAARTEPDHLWPLMSRPGAVRELTPEPGAQS
jgi:glycosyltransferase involved in cell wall biosynthesis